MASNRHFGHKYSHFGEDGKGHEVKIYGDNIGDYFKYDPAGGNVDVGGDLIVGGTISADINPVIKVVAGEAIAAGQLVYPSGYDADKGKIKVKKSDADAASPSNVAWFVAPEGISDAAEGVVVGMFELTGQNTDSASAVGDPVYLNTTAGGWTLIAPTSGGHTVQQVGVVTVKSATAGKVLLMPFYSKGLTKHA